MKKEVEHIINGVRSKVEARRKIGRKRGEF
jgi:hypothetical protein